MRQLFFMFVMVLTSCVFAPQTGTAEENGQVVVLSVDGAISPAYMDYVRGGIADATVDGAGLVILELNTPGGLLSSTRQMVKDIMGAKVPVVVYVTPSGAHAASAGTFILMAGHIAAMEEGTNVGAATPVQIGELPFQAPLDPADKTSVDHQDINSQHLHQKMIQDTTAFIRAIAEMRGRNADFAEKAVNEALSMTAAQALQNNVVDIVAVNRADLLHQIDGRSVQMKDQSVRALNTKNVRIVERPPGLITKFLAFISDPNVAAILMMIGIYGLILEFYAPGTMVSGTIGAISLLLAFYAFSILPVTGLGAMLLLCGLLFIVGETFLPSFGILGVAGLVAMAIGFAIIFDGSQMMGIGLEWQVILGILVSLVVFMGIAFGMLVKSVIKKELKTGPEAMIGKRAKVVEWAEDHTGIVLTNGERWQAFSPEDEDTYVRDDVVLISAVDGLKLKVRKEDA